MEEEEVRKTYLDLRAQLRGAKVIHKRMFLSTLQLYLLRDESGERENALEIWCESPWELTDATDVLADSRTITGDSAAYDAAQRLVSRAADVLIDRTVENIYLVKETQSLCVVFSGGLEACTLPSEYIDHEQWMLRGPGGQPEVAGCEEGIYPVERDPQGHRIWPDGW